MCRFIAEGRAVVEAQNRYGRIFQVGTYGRFGAKVTMDDPPWFDRADQLCLLVFNLD